MAAHKPIISRLRVVVEQASRDHPHLTSRLETAAFLMLVRPIVSLGDHHYRIGSEDGLRNYGVLNGHCECSDFATVLGSHASTGWHSPRTKG